MTKSIAVRMTDKQTGETYTWTVRKFDGVNVGVGKRSRRITGWIFTSHDGCERISEGNWMELVPMFHLVADNYGLTCNLS